MRIEKRIKKRGKKLGLKLKFKKDGDFSNAINNAYIAFSSPTKEILDFVKNDTADNDDFSYVRLEYNPLWNELEDGPAKDFLNQKGISEPKETILHTIAEHEFGHKLICPIGKNLSQKIATVIYYTAKAKGKPLPQQLVHYFENAFDDLIVNAVASQTVPHYADGLMLSYYEKIDSRSKRQNYIKHVGQFEGDAYGKFFSVFLGAHNEYFNDADIRALIEPVLNQEQEVRDASREMANLLHANDIKDPETWDALSAEITLIFLRFLEDLEDDSQDQQNLEKNSDCGTAESKIPDDFCERAPIDQALKKEHEKTEGGKTTEAEMQDSIDAEETNEEGDPLLIGRDLSEKEQNGHEEYEKKAKAFETSQPLMDLHPSLPSPFHLPVHFDPELYCEAEPNPLRFPVENIIILLDHSNSMFGEPYDQCATFVYCLLRHLKDKVQRPITVKIGLFSDGLSQQSPWFNPSQYAEIAPLFIFPNHWSGTILEHDAMDKLFEGRSNTLMFLITDGAIFGIQNVAEYFKKHSEDKALNFIQIGGEDYITNTFEGLKNVKIATITSAEDIYAYGMTELNDKLNPKHKNQP